MNIKSVLAPNELGPTICIGEILVEIMSVTAGDGFTSPISLTGPYASGAPAIFIDQCARLGGAAAIIGTVGDDDFGRLNIQRLKNDGVDVSAIKIDPHLPTGSAFVRYRKDGERDFVFNIAKSAAANITWNEKIDALIQRAGHLHIMGTILSMAGTWEIIEKAASSIKSRGGTLSLDPNIRKELYSDPALKERVKKLLTLTDLLLPSGHELELTAGTKGVEPSVEKLFSLGIKEVALKQGRQGAVYFGGDGRKIHSAAFDVDEVDPTGAGDCFGGAYVACRRCGMPPEEALDWANAAGARNVAFKGPMEGAATRAELTEFITNTPRRI